MKSLFTFLISLLLISDLNAQTLNAFLTGPTCLPTLTISNGAVLMETTSPMATTIDRILFKNTSASTHTYTVYRTILFNSPALDVTCANISPDTYFTFGFSAFPDCVNTPPSSDWTVLGPAGSSLAPFDGSCANGNPFYIYLDEDATIGQYHVKYKLQNVANANDTLAFTIKYNIALNVKEKDPFAVLNSIYPNPSNGSFTINGLTQDMSVEISDNLGRLIYLNKKIEENFIRINDLPPGFYFVSIKTGEKIIGVKKLICE